MIGAVIGSHFVEHLGFVFKRAKAVQEAGRNRRSLHVSEK
jgi:hypothetical protein